MNITELDSYNLGDAVKFNDHLNPRLWDANEHLKPEVKAQLLLIAEDFREFLGVTDLDLEDITISGSNAAYTYTPSSDIDLHLIVKMPDDAVYRELFGAKKFQYNEQHNIKIGGYDVELYVQAADEPHVSQGIYSVLNDDWVQVPRRRRAEVDDTSTRNKYEKVGLQIERAVRSGNLKRITQLAEKIKRMRQTGLEQHGEFGPENLAFKMLRTQGLIKQLYDARNAAKDRELSLKEKVAVKTPVKYGFRTPEIVEAAPAEPTPVPSDEEILKDFIDFCFKELKLKQMPTVKLRRDPEWSVRNKTFGRYINDQHLLEVAWGNRHIMDVLRTVAHELTHKHQHERDGQRMGPDAGETGSPYENEANARAGILMRDYARLHPDYFAVGQAEDLKEEIDKAYGILGYKVVVRGEYFYVYKGDQLIYRSVAPRTYTYDQLVNQVKRAISVTGSTVKNPGVVAKPKSGLEDAYKKLIQIITYRVDRNLDVTPETIKKEVEKIVSDYQVPEKDLREKWAQTKISKYSNYQRSKYTKTPELFAAFEQITKYFQDQSRSQWDDKKLYKIRVAGQENQWIENKMQEFMQKHGLSVTESASGYIPTKRQAKDPRFSMALTQDIRPGQLGREANKLKLKTNRQGVPQVANPNGLFEKLALELSQFKTVTESTEQLDEVRMAPSNLMQWATSPEAQGVRAGFEAELIFRDATNNGDSDYEMEPDYDSDERCTSLGQVVDFFESGDYGISSRQADRLREQLDEAYYEWYDEQMHKDFKDEAEDLIRKVIVDEGDWDLDNEIQKQLALLDLTDDEMNAIINAGERAPKFTSSKEQILYAEANPLYDKYLDAQKEAEGLLDDLVADEVSKQGANWDAALDDFRDNYQIDDDSGFFDDVGLRWMSDVASSYDLDWPYMTRGGGNDGSRDWESIGDSLHDTIDMPVKVSSGYHNATRKEGLWIVEPDTSLEPDDREDFGLEIVSPPMPLLTALEKLQQVCDWANNPQEGNAYTNGSTGLHMGVSVPFKGGDVDYLKLILFLGDEYVLKSFGREANTYCKSAMSKFKENIKGGRANPMGVIKLMQSGLLELAHREIQKGVGDGKYTSAHIQKGYIEFRSPGGDWLAEESADPEKLQSTMLRFARAMSLAANPAEERREYAKKLYKLVAPEGDSELALFSQFASGELTAEQLKKRWSEKTIGTEKKMNQRWKLYQKVDGRWEPVPAAEWNGYSEDQVKNAVWSKYGREALDSGEYQLVNMGEQDWEVYDVKTGVTLEIVKGKSKGEVADAVYDKYVDQGIGFQVRPWEDPATMTPRAKLAKRITAKKPEPIDYNYEIVNLSDVHLRVVDRFYADSKQEADKTFDKWLEIKGLPNDTHNYGYRPRKQEAAKEPAVQDTDINVAQNFEPTQVRASNGVPAWEIYERESGHVINTIFDHDQTSAWQQAQLYLRDIGAEQPNLFSLRPKMAQNFGNDPMAAYERNSDRIDAIRQNATDRVGSWAIYDVTLGREINRMTDVPWQQASDRADELEQSTGHNMSVRGLSEAIDPISGRGAVAPTMPPRLKPKPKVKPVAPAVRVDIKKHKEDPLAQTYKKPVNETLPAKNLNQLYTIKRQLANPAFSTAEPAEKPVPARPAQPRVHTALADLQRQRDKVQQIMDLKQEIETLTARAGRTRYGITPGLGADIEDIYPNPATEADMDAAIQGYEVQKKKLTDYIARQRKVFPKEAVEENFADGRGPGRPGDSQRHGIPKGATMAELEKASHSAGRKGQLARWQLNMRRGHKK